MFDGINSIVLFVIVAAAAVLVAVLMVFAVRSLKRGDKQGLKENDDEQAPKKQKKPRLKWLGIIGLGAVLWLLIVWMINILFGPSPQAELSISIWAERVSLFGLDLSTTIVLSWWIIGVLGILGLLVRLILVPRMKDRPQGIQAVLETAVEWVAKYTDDKVPGLGDNLGAYIFTVALFLIGCAIVELFGLHSPAADLTMTFSLAFVTFVLINYYGIKRKGVGGRVKGLASPNPVVFPLRVVSDIAIPVSLACRLFGNMLGGMIVIDLIYMAMGHFAIGIPSLLGLYFNVFHPVIQLFIFITLSLTFIGEAAE